MNRTDWRRVASRPALIRVERYDNLWALTVEISYPKGGSLTKVFGERDLRTTIAKWRRWRRASEPVAPPEPRITPAMVDRLAQNVRNQLGWLRISEEDRAMTLKTIRNWVRKENARTK